MWYVALCTHHGNGDDHTSKGDNTGRHTAPGGDSRSYGVQAGGHANTTVR